jgi:Rho-binding antiterminator
MAHRVGRCDFLDVLEESATIRTPVAVELVEGLRFTDVVRDVSTRDGEDYATFRDHGEVAVSDIRSANRAVPLETGYPRATTSRA